MFRIAILGTGKIVRTRFLPAAMASPNVEVTFIGSRDPERVDRKDLGLSSDVEIRTYAECLDPNLVDGIYLGLPNDQHAEWIEKSAHAGLHVLCEKPLTSSLQEALRCNEVCGRSKVLLAEAFMYRRDPRHLFVQQQLKAGVIGYPRYIHSSFCYLLNDLNNIRLSKQRSGGALMDVGCYGIDLARLLTGEEPIVATALSMEGKQSGVDELINICVAFPSGILAQVTSSTHCHRHHAYQVHGTDGVIEVPFAFIPQPDQPIKVIIRPSNQKPKAIDFAPVDTFGLQLDAFFSAASSGDFSCWYPGESGLNNAKALDLIRSSIKPGGIVDYIG